MKSLIPVVMSGIIAGNVPPLPLTHFLPLSLHILTLFHGGGASGVVYGLVVSVLIAGGLAPDQPYSLYAGFIHLAAGMCCGFTGLAAGYAIGIVGDAVSRLALALLAFGGTAGERERGVVWFGRRRQGRDGDGGGGRALADVLLSFAAVCSAFDRTSMRAKYSSPWSSS
jgi:hypothetical protein